MTPYEEYLESCKKYANDNRSIIEDTKRKASDIIFPQNILMAKTVIKDGNFYFTEKLVNRLMLFAYLKGSRAVDEDSYKMGWNDSKEEMTNKIVEVFDIDLGYER
jgi:hypothetical protein